MTRTALLAAIGAAALLPASAPAATRAPHAPAATHAPAAPPAPAVTHARAAAHPGAAHPGATTARAKVRTGLFKVELEGVQRTTWSTDWSSTEGCDLSVHGSGSETVRFRSKPTTILVTWIGQTRVFTRGRAIGALDLAATITRHGSEQADGEVCSDGDGGGAPAAPDCGTKRSRRTVELGYPVRRSDVIALRTDHNVPLGPFRSCPTGGVSWPSLLDTHPVTGRVVGAALPIADLFRHGKNVVIARDRAVQDSGGDRSTTTIRWTLSFTRLGGKPPAQAASRSRSSPVRRSAP
ncbi:hypothetical protein [Conexibacter arvalis]|uniref:Uncharacterized protein n=1 Tax=Conexibacter arvalis TaxID=912552 RepID=A0A840IDX4_9ACTN|nr:hypothetical protein [Conexibacter arvalis]MBB4662228.1 hypothetical protein [Conexibacter arvalis]